jgi:hypothetical protein
MPAITCAFFDLEIYAIYRAIWELWGDEAWKVVWRSGEIALEEIEKTLPLAGPWPDALDKLAAYLCQAGYADDIRVHQIAENELEYEMVNPAILPGAKRLIAEGAVPAHISTTLMFALLARLGLKAEMIGPPDLRPDGRGIERWRLSPLASSGPHP